MLTKGLQDRSRRFVKSIDDPSDMFAQRQVVKCSFQLVESECTVND